VESSRELQEHLVAPSNPIGLWQCLQKAQDLQDLESLEVRKEGFLGYLVQSRIPPCPRILRQPTVFLPLEGRVQLEGAALQHVVVAQQVLQSTTSRSTAALREDS